MDRCSYGTHQLQLKHDTRGTHVYNECIHHEMHTRFSYTSVILCALILALRAQTNYVASLHVILDMCMRVAILSQLYTNMIRGSTD